MRYFLVDTGKMGTSFNYPDPGHSDYVNCGYSPDEKQCIWRTKDEVDMKVNKLSGLQEITKTEVKNYLSNWGVE